MGCNRECGTAMKVQAGRERWMTRRDMKGEIEEDDDRSQEETWIERRTGEKGKKQGKKKER